MLLLFAFFSEPISYYTQHFQNVNIYFAFFSEYEVQTYERTRKRAL